jgi:hypothetical protein
MSVTSQITRKIALATAAVAVAASCLAVEVAPAEAKIIKVYGPKGIHHHEHGRGFGFVADGSGGCYWMKVRAIRLDSGYWWDRYHDCTND